MTRMSAKQPRIQQIPAPSRGEVQGQANGQYQHSRARVRHDQRCAEDGEAQGARPRAELGDDGDSEHLTEERRLEHEHAVGAVDLRAVGERSLRVVMLDDERRRREILYPEKKSRADDELQRPLGDAEQRQESRHAQKELYDSIALIPARHGEHVREMEAGEQQHRGDGKGLRLKALDEAGDADQHQVKRQSGGIDPRIAV